MLDLTSKQSTDDFVATGDITLRGARVALQGSTRHGQLGDHRDEGALPQGQARLRRRRPRLHRGPGTDRAARELLADHSGAARSRWPTAVSGGARSLHRRGPGQPVPARRRDDPARRDAACSRSPSARASYSTRATSPRCRWPSRRCSSGPRIGQLLWLLLVVVFLGLCLRRFGKYVGSVIEEHYADDAGWLEKVAPRDRARCVAARRTAALAHRAETFLDVVGAITAPVALIIIVTSMCGVPPWELPGFGWTRIGRDRVDVAGRRHVRRPDRPRLADPALGEGPQGRRRHLGPDHLLAARGAPAGAALLRRAGDPGAADPLPLGAGPARRGAALAEPADPVRPQPGLADRAGHGQPARRRGARRAPG